MQNISRGILGYAGMSAFQTKAEALQYAIDFTAIHADGGLKADYEAAKEMFDFICKNVKLPETKSESLDGFMGKSIAFLDLLHSQLKSFKEKQKTCSDVEEKQKDYGDTEVPPARPLDEAPDFMADGPVVNSTGPFTAE